MNSFNQDTIAAISTASAPSGIGIVRISGKEAIPVAAGIFRAASGKPLSGAKSHTIQYGHIEAGGTILDEVLVSVFVHRKPIRGKTSSRSTVTAAHW